MFFISKTLSNQIFIIGKFMEKIPIVTSHNLNHYFGKGFLKKQILFDINFQIKSGEIVILMGQSGSGKTTLLTLIGGLRTVQHGTLKVFGKNLDRASNNQIINIRRGIGYIFQAHNLLKFLTVSQNVQMSTELHGGFSKQEAQARSKAMLEAVGLSHRLNYYPDDLSGGQKQRVAIARALVSHPKLVLADEPTAALDSKSGRDVVELMQKLAKEQGCSILIVTHDNRILDVADRIIKMEDGHLISS
jgi:putative ABC transport system ATP-binding protein